MRKSLHRILPILAMIVVPLLLLTGAAVAQGLTPLAVDCSQSQLDKHTGFQVAPACSDTGFGEISDQAKNPTLLIVGTPDKIKVGKDFTLEVSTRNLIRDRFLAAGQGGYYLESALLDANGLTRGHFHVACRVLSNDDRAPGNPEAVPEFFKAVEDGGGSAKADVVKVVVPGKNAAGANTFKKGQLVQCSAWAGDGSHRIPMMERANQTPALDSVRLSVRGW